MGTGCGMGQDLGVWRPQTWFQSQLCHSPTETLSSSLSLYLCICKVESGGNGDKTLFQWIIVQVQGDTVCEDLARVSPRT